MTIKTALLCAAISAAATGVPAVSQARVNVDIDIAPPALRTEVVPAPRRGYEWAPGYWNYSGRRHVWVGGHWIRERRGHHWVADTWVQHDNHWRREPGHWD